MPAPPAAPAIGQPPRRRRRAAPYLILLFGTLLGVLGLTSCIESSVFYFPSRDPFVTPPGVEDVTFKTSDGLTLHGWFMPGAGRAPGSPAGPVILHTHGNAGNIESHVEFSRFLTSAGLSVFIFDYRGYGRSDPASHLNRGKLFTDTQAALDYLLSRPDVDPRRVGVYGVSVGSSFALALAAQRPEVRAAAEVSGFSTWRSIAGDHLPLLGPLLIRSGLDPLDSVKRLGTRPLLIIHGQLDTIVPVRHADILARAAKEAGTPVTGLVVPGAEHNDIIFESAPARDTIADFFSRTLSVPN